MTKNTPKPRGNTGTTKGVVGAAKPDRNVLPSGGLALPKLVAEDIDSDASSPGIPTPASDTYSAGGYFAQFSDFTPHVDAGFVAQFNRLAVHNNWSGTEKTRRRNEAIEIEFSHYFGDDYSDVALWRRLCVLVGIPTEGLSSITKCKKALSARKVMVNLVNLIDHLKNGTPLVRFDSFKAFQKYTSKPGRRLNRNVAKKNNFVRVLLRHVF